MQLQREVQTKQTKRLSLDDLARLSCAELERLYRDAPEPKSLSALDGDLQGRMLAVRWVSRSPLARRLRRFSGARGFPWGGKSFKSESAARGGGINRVNLWGKHRLFPFDTCIGASRIDGRDAVILDYDLAVNPGAIRKIHDEVREVAPGLWLGPAMWKTAGEPAFVLWFALDTRGRAER